MRCVNCMEDFEGTNGICPHCHCDNGAAQNELYQLPPGTILAGRYLLGLAAAFGGFGTLYKAFDMQLNTMVAVKEFYPTNLVMRMPGDKKVILYKGKGLSEFQNGLERFLYEARNAVKFDRYCNIVNVFDYFRENDTAYIVMEYLVGDTLKELVKKRGQGLDYQQAVEYILPVADALSIVHKEGILHRDVSPDNIMICRDGRVVLIDFGAARFSTGEEEKTLSIELKPGFAPPEQYRMKSKQGPWTDIYALGATLYYAITGQKPEESTNRLKEDTLIPVRELAGDTPVYIENIIMKAMALIPELRFQTAESFQTALIQKKQVKEVEKELKTRKWKRAWGVAALSVVLLLVAAGSYRSYLNKKTEAYLAPSTITVWISVGEGKSSKERLQAMSQEFLEDYPDIMLDIVEIPQKEYEERIMQARQERNMPTLFENNGLSPKLEGSMEGLEDVLAMVSPSDYYFLDQYENHYPKKEVLPLGWDMMVLYGNEKLMNNGDLPAETNDKQAFLQGDSLAYIATVKDYSEIQEALPGLYVPIPVKTETYSCEFTDMWSISKSSDEKEKLAAKRLLFYLLGERAQDICYIQNMSGLPLNKNIADIFFDVNMELEYIEGLTGTVAFNGMDKEQLYHKLFLQNKDAAEMLKSWIGDN